MTAIGGSVKGIAIAGRLFAVDAEEAVELKKGGLENEVKINGDGTGRLVKTRAPWSIDGAKLKCSNQDEDLDFLQGKADGPTFFPVMITLVDDSRWQGSGQIEGEIVYDSQNATVDVSLKGTGVLTQQ